MPEAIAVSFRLGGKPQFFDPQGRDYQVGQWVLAETDRGLELGQVVRENTAVPDARLRSPLRPLVRLATSSDHVKDRANREREREALDLCRLRVTEHGLPMRLVDALYSIDGKRLTVYFSSENRVDFRALVRDLASHLRTRIELQQLGVRDMARVVGGYGTCGQQLCCQAWLPEFYPTAIKMAKEQGLSLNPTKVSGLCGRLLCCLRYEYDTYVQLRKHAPKQGRTVESDRGPARIKDLSLLKGEALLEFSDGRTEWRPYDAFMRRPAPPAHEAEAPASAPEEPITASEPEAQEAVTDESGRKRPPAERVGGRTRSRRKGRRGAKAAPASGEAPADGGAASQPATKKTSSRTRHRTKKQPAAEASAPGQVPPPASKSASRRKRRRRKPSSGGGRQTDQKSDG